MSGQPAEAGLPAASGAQLRALVVDDDPTNVLYLRTLLNWEGFQIVEAGDGVEAIERFQQQRPDIVFMDVMMPRMDGYEATRRIKAMSGETFVPVIFLTALSDEESLARCVTAGGDDFLTKPFNQVILRAKTQALGRIRALGLLGGEGFFILRMSGKGMLLLNSFGAVHKIELKPAQEYIVDNSHLVAWSTTTTYNIEKATSGWVASFTSGEGFVCRFRGPVLYTFRAAILADLERGCDIHSGYRVMRTSIVNRHI